jgi:hypothetical protein
VALLEIQWRTASSIAPEAVVTGESAEESVAKQKAMIAEKPMIVYILSDDPTDSDTAKIDQLHLSREQVGVGAKFFDTIKMTSGDAAQDKILKETGRATPRFVFLTREYKVADVLSGNELSGGGVLKAMQSVVRAEYVTNFDAMVKEFIDLLNDLDRLDAKKTALEQKKARKGADKKVAKEEAEYQAQMAALEAKKSKLLDLKAKGDEPKPDQP